MRRFLFWLGRDSVPPIPPWISDPERYWASVNAELYYNGWQWHSKLKNTLFWEGKRPKGCDCLHCRHFDPRPGAMNRGPIIGRLLDEYGEFSRNQKLKAEAARLAREWDDKIIADFCGKSRAETTAEETLAQFRRMAKPVPKPGLMGFPWEYDGTIYDTHRDAEDAWKAANRPSGDGVRKYTACELNAEKFAERDKILAEFFAEPTKKDSHMAEKAYWIVTCPDNPFGALNDYKRYDSERDARERAKKYASEKPPRCYVVLKAVGESRVVSPSIWTDYE